MNTKEQKIEEAKRAGCEVAYDCGLAEIYAPVNRTFRNHEHIIWDQDIEKASFETIACRDLAELGWCDFCSER